MIGAINVRDKIIELRNRAAAEEQRNALDAVAPAQNQPPYSRLGHNRPSWIPTDAYRLAQIPQAPMFMPGFMGGGMPLVTDQMMNAVRAGWQAPPRIPYVPFERNPPGAPGLPSGMPGMMPMPAMLPGMMGGMPGMPGMGAMGSLSGSYGAGMPGIGPIPFSAGIF